MGRVLVVEDDPDIADPLSVVLESDGHDVVVVDAGAEAIAQASCPDFDLVLLDLGLPDLDGLDVCRRLRAAGSTVPILVLTGRAEEVDAVRGLDAGADDYVAKPFRVEELRARVRAILRRHGEPESVEVNGVRIERAARRAWCGDDELDLTPKEFALLEALVTRAGTVVTRSDLMRDVWRATWIGSTKTLDMHVSWLRRKLGDDPARPRFITTVRGVGFRFEAADG